MAAPRRRAAAAFAFAVLFAALLTVVACVESETEDVDEGGIDGEVDSNYCGVSFEEDMLPFFDSYCLRCHSEQVEGDARRGAPADLNFDTQELVLANAEDVRGALLDNSGQPPSPPYPTAYDRDRVLAWIDCAERVRSEE
ncbi:hypothetical protein K8I61_19020 [bacterium]|nr:hypothetical protein [bacterium]